MNVAPSIIKGDGVTVEETRFWVLELMIRAESDGASETEVPDIVMRGPSEMRVCEPTTYSEATFGVMAEPAIVIDGKVGNGARLTVLLPTTR